MRIANLKQWPRRIHRSEEGTAMTEFVMFLPIWIIVFIGVVNLGKIGITGTKVQVVAQKDLWQKAIAVTDGFEGKHMTPPGAAGFSAAGYFDVAGQAGNPQKALDTVEGSTMGIGLGIFGHYGESYQRTVLLQPVMQDGIDPEFQPSAVLGMDPPRYPHLLLNDTLGDQSFSGGWSGILATAVSASGLIPSLAAGARYGTVFAESSGTTKLTSDWVNVTARSHWDVIVAPRPITGAAGTGITFGVAFLAAKLDENYMHYQQFGKTNWGGGDGTAETPTDDTDIKGEAEDEAKKECDAERAAYDPDPDNDPDTPPPPKPQKLQDCEAQGL